MVLHIVCYGTKSINIVYFVHQSARRAAVGARCDRNEVRAPRVSGGRQAAVTRLQDRAEEPHERGAPADHPAAGGAILSAAHQTHYQVSAAAISIPMQIRSFEVYIYPDWKV